MLVNFVIISFLVFNLIWKKLILTNSVINRFKGDSGKPSSAFVSDIRLNVEKRFGSLLVQFSTNF